jgi:hypothetical protein
VRHWTIISSIAPTRQHCNHHHPTTAYTQLNTTQPPPPQHTRPPDLIHSYYHFAPQRIVISSISTSSRHSGCSSQMGQSPPPKLRQNHRIRACCGRYLGLQLDAPVLLWPSVHTSFLAFRFETSREQPHVLRSRSVCCLQRYTASINCEVVACRPSKGLLWQLTFSICPPLSTPSPSRLCSRRLSCFSLSCADCLSACLITWPAV